MNTLVLLAVARALDSRIAGRRIRRAGLLSERELGLVMAGLREPSMLVLAAEPGAPHLRFERSRAPNRRLTEQLATAPDLLAGAEILRVGLVGGERILCFTLGAYQGGQPGDHSDPLAAPPAEPPGAQPAEPPGAQPAEPPGAQPAEPLALYFEMLPRSPILVVTQSGAIVAAMRPPGTRRADDRRMARGGPYVLPFTLGAPDAVPSLGSALAAAGASGTDPVAAAVELMHGVPAEHLSRLFAGAAGANEAVARLVGYAGPLALVTNERGEPELHAEYPAAGEPPPDPGAVLAALASWAERRRAEARARDLRTAAHRALKKTAAKSARARAALAADRAALGDAADLRRRGSALLAHLAQVPRGAATVELADPSAEGSSLVIALDPQRSPAANADAIFQAARRAERARDRLDTRAQELASMEKKIAEAAMRVTTAAEEELPAVVAELARSGLVPPDLAPGPEARTGATKQAAGPAERLPYRTYALGGGWEIRVGRSDADNDVLTHELAHPRDTWLHVHGAAGSHVILRRTAGGHGVPPPAVLARAAAAAAHWSAARHSGLVPVIITEKRYVRRPRRSPPGTAVCLRAKTVMVEPQKPAAAEESAGPGPNRDRDDGKPRTP